MKNCPLCEKYVVEDESHGQECRLDRVYYFSQDGLESHVEGLPKDFVSHVQ
jgi:hypothetical protein